MGGLLKQSQSNMCLRPSHGLGVSINNSLTMFKIHHLNVFVFFSSMAEQYVSQGNALSVVLFVCTPNSLLEVVTQYGP